MTARVWASYLVHVYTASGLVPAFFTAVEVASETPRPSVAFLWLALAALIDATDGPLARRLGVERHAPNIRGRTMDDIVDYLNFTFLPLLLVWRMEWLAPPTALWILLALVASAFGFANVAAKESERGVFLGFPSYWNVVAFYVGIAASRWGTLAPTVLVVLLTILTLSPVRFVYPNRAPSGWRAALFAGGLAWLVLLLAMLRSYPRVDDLPLALSLAYPALHVVASVRIALARQRAS